jgi:uncharacterized membrane protein YidH (DUF202 family)
MDDPGLARERTALAWTRSALTMAASGVLIARAAFVGHLPVLGVVIAVAMAIVSTLTWRRGEAIYRESRGPWMPGRLQVSAFGLLTVATVLIAAIAIMVTVAI